MTELPGRIVYVDENYSLRQDVRMAFNAYDRDKRLVVATCGGGRELVSRIRELQPDLILLDVQMSEMDGPDTVDALRRVSGGEDTPIVFVTDKNKLQMSNHYKNIGVIGVVHKPFEVESLPQRVFRLWEESFGQPGVEMKAPNGRVLGSLDDGEEIDTFDV
jgi:two-component system OmpR family response regulator